MIVDRMHLYLFVGALVPDGDRWMSRRNCADSEFDLMGSVVMEEYGHKFGNQPQRRKVHGMTSPFLASVLGLQAGSLRRRYSQ